MFCDLMMILYRAFHIDLRVAFCFEDVVFPPPSLLCFNLLLFVAAVDHVEVLIGEIRLVRFVVRAGHCFYLQVISLCVARIQNCAESRCCQRTKVLKARETA